MNVSHGKTKVALAVLAMAASGGASAVPMILTGITGGSYGVYLETSPGTLTKPVLQQNLGGAASALLGNAVTPGGNVELNRLGGMPFPETDARSVTTMTGHDGLGHSVSLSSLRLSDWTNGGQSLAKEYIQGAANRAGLGTLTAGQMSDALTQFFTANVNLGGLEPWRYVSDPNISYVEIYPTKVHVGLAGFLNATPFLETVFGVDLDDGLQVSEVVKWAFGGGTGYGYGFLGTPSMVATSDGSYNANFDIAIPEPGALALLGIGLVGLFLGRRRRV